tara:strand:- start:698 stop:808 length:111 start_codon:yes stop_codon:yes gene_type:complete
MEKYKKVIYMGLAYGIGIVIANYIQTKFIDKKKQTK